MKTIRALYWRRGGVLLGMGIGCISTGALRWGTDGLYRIWGTLMLVGLLLAAIGTVYFGYAAYQVTLKLILRQRSLRVRVDAELVSKRRGRNRYYIYAKCVSPAICEEIWVSSVALLEDPTPYLKDGVDVLFSPDNGRLYYMLAEEIGK